MPSFAEDARDSKQARKRQKRKEREEKEAAISRAEAARLQGDATPETVEDFERLVLASPNSSFVWIKYMAFMLGLTEVDKARAVAERWVFLILCAFVWNTSAEI